MPFSWEDLPKPILALAPMAGVTDAAFRQICRRFGADVIYTEFVSTDAISRGNAKTLKMMQFDPSEQPVICQVFGKDPMMYASATRVIERMGYAGIDINFGCPAYKVTRHGGGVTLMRNLDLCRSIVQATCEAAQTIPVSIKIRASVCRQPGEKKSSLDRVTAVDLIEHIRDLPVAAVMIHGRSYERPFDGEPDLDSICAVRAAFPRIVLANGGIYDPETAKSILHHTKADGVGIARGSWGRPWIFQQIRTFLETGVVIQPSWEEIKTIILEHAKLAFRSKGDRGILEMRKHLAWYIKGRAGASRLRQQFMHVQSIRDVKSLLDQTEDIKTEQSL
ncbi:MAG: tRNA-dihydrouridine synthase [Patescibacteria group bacterium]